jgi:hypothetical protein
MLVLAKRSLAQRQYEEFSRVMEDELGLGPDEACQESFQNLINQARPAREDTWPSPAAVPPSRLSSRPSFICQK